MTTLKKTDQNGSTVELSLAQLELLYNLGYKLFQSGKYKDALSYFTVLRQFEPLKFRSNFSVAACHHYLKDYPNAIENYMISTYLAPQNPVPYMHLFDCHMHQKAFGLAGQALKEAIARAADVKEYSVLRTKAELELIKLKKEYQI